MAVRLGQRPVWRSEAAGLRAGPAASPIWGRTMAKYILRRVIQAIPVLIGISLITYFILIIAPGGPLARFAQNPRDHAGADRGIPAPLGPAGSDPHPVLQVAGRVRRKAFLINALPGGTITIGDLTIQLPVAATTASSTATSATRSSTESGHRRHRQRASCRPSSSPARPTSLDRARRS